MNDQGESEEEMVPTSPPYGGITDGSVYCSRCGEELTGCILCAGEPRALVRGQSTALSPISELDMRDMSEAARSWAQVRRVIRRMKHHGNDPETALSIGQLEQTENYLMGQCSDIPVVHLRFIITQ